MNKNNRIDRIHAKWIFLLSLSLADPFISPSPAMAS